MKIVKNDYLGLYSWDATGNNNYGINDWSESDLMKELNSDYLNYSLTKNVTNWYNSYSSSSGPVLRQTAEFDYRKTIKQQYQNMINDSVWNLGGNLYSNPSTAPYGIPLLDEYTKERGTLTYQNSHQTTWTGKVGLIYPSDYGYASTDEKCHNNLRYGITYENSTYDYTNVACKNNNWLYKDSWYWTLTPYISNVKSVFGIHNSGAVALYEAFASGRVLPSVYLKSTVKIESGTGTSTDPYILK